MALYLNISQPMGGSLGWEDGKRLDELDGIFSELIRQLNFLLGNLGAENVIEAASVKAENIDTTNAKIVNAQIKNLTASKIKAGTLDLSKGITITNGGSDSMTITQDSIRIEVNGVTRFLLTPDNNGTFGFGLYNAAGEPTVVVTGDGNAVFTGTVESSVVESSEIYASHIAGVDKEKYDAYENQDEGEGNGAFVDIGHTGLKIMQDMENGTRQQKIGMTSDSGGSPILVIGSGTGEEEPPINGVSVPTGSLTLRKDFSGNVHTGNIMVSGNNSALYLTAGTVGINAPDMVFNVSNNMVWNGSRIATESYVNQQIEDVKDWVQQQIQGLGQ